jgi:hypothetical protein
MKIRLAAIFSASILTTVVSLVHAVYILKVGGVDELVAAVVEVSAGKYPFLSHLSLSDRILGFCVLDCVQSLRGRYGVVSCLWIRGERRIGTKGV